MRLERLQASVFAGALLAAACAAPEPGSDLSSAVPSVESATRPETSPAGALPPFESIGAGKADEKPRDAAAQAAELRQIGELQSRVDLLQAEITALRGATEARAGELSHLVDEMNQMLGGPIATPQDPPRAGMHRAGRGEAPPGAAMDHDTAVDDDGMDDVDLTEVRVDRIGSSDGVAPEDWYANERARLEGRISELQNELAREEQALVRYSAGVEAALAERRRLATALEHAEAERQLAARLERERNRPRLVLHCCTRMGQIPGAMEIEFTVTNYGGRTGRNEAIVSMWVVEDPWVPGLPEFDPGRIPIELGPGEQQIYSYRWPYVPDPYDGFKFRFDVHLEGPEWSE